MLSGETLRMLRNIRGLKQETLAKKLGISQPAYSKLEKLIISTMGNYMRSSVQWVFLYKNFKHF